MFEFLDRLISIVIPRVRDFRGLKTSSFDQAGNFSMGLGDQLVDVLRHARCFSELTVGPQWLTTVDNGRRMIV